MSVVTAPAPGPPPCDGPNSDVFGDCALVEIIHLHDCLRGALKTLANDVSGMNDLLVQQQQSQQQSQSQQLPKQSMQDIVDLERRVSARFQVIWSVFRAHSAAEDEFIWPALKLKTQGLITGSPKHEPNYDDIEHHHEHQHHEHHHGSHSHSGMHSTNDASATASTVASSPADQSTQDPTPSQQQQPQQQQQQKQQPTGVIEQEEYEEDHADEERMFSEMDRLLTDLRKELIKTKQVQPESVKTLIASVQDRSQTLCQHLLIHLRKEEQQCMPLVIKHLSKPEIDELVGQIMGKRSSEVVGQIMTMAVQSLNSKDRAEMVSNMKRAMSGTFFDRWLSMSGWMDSDDQHPALTGATKTDASCASDNVSVSDSSTATDAVAVVVAAQQKRPLDDDGHNDETQAKRAKHASTASSTNAHPSRQHQLEQREQEHNSPQQHQRDLPSVDANINPELPNMKQSNKDDVTSQTELQKLIRAIASNSNLSSQQKTTTIQGLRDSIWKNNQRVKQKIRDKQIMAKHEGGDCSHLVTALGSPVTEMKRDTPPSRYFKKIDGATVQIRNPFSDPMICSEVGTMPLFSSSELAPTHHDGTTGAVLGCPHYARACKLRHPKSGKLYTCRLCCDQERELPSGSQDEQLDRYAVSEVMCMKCNTLQPADKGCINTECELNSKSFAKYFCKICHLYDDRPRPIFHCPYCNTCRMGKGLGIDYRHCMRCNACVLLTDKNHRCIPQKLQGSCPICHESLFQSTQPLRGLKCGHVMHLSCFTQFRRQSYTCPLCCRSMEDMKDYFALLDTAIRTQPMPIMYMSLVSTIYCQDCEKTGQCNYHFVGQKCSSCGSYNTRELSRTQRGAT